MNTSKANGALQKSGDSVANFAGEAHASMSDRMEGGRDNGEKFLQEVKERIEAYIKNGTKRRN